MIWFIGSDPNGIKRVWSRHQDADVAESRCRDEALNYLKTRPDTGPLSLWIFSRNEQR